MVITIGSFHNMMEKIINENWNFSSHVTSHSIALYIYFKFLLGKFISSFKCSVIWEDSLMNSFTWCPLNISILPYNPDKNKEITLSKYCNLWCVISMTVSWRNFTGSYIKLKIQNKVYHIYKHLMAKAFCRKSKLRDHAFVWFVSMHVSYFLSFIM